MSSSGKANAGDLIAQRRAATRDRFERLKTLLKSSVSPFETSACVSATGSFARLEASPHSDLDLFIVTPIGPANQCPTQPLLNRLDGILLKAELIRATRDQGIPDFSNEGEYLEIYSVSDLVNTLGKREDDVRNTLTARLLPLLESKQLVGQEVYDKVITEVTAAYWRSFQDHESSFVPAFLTNDILRLWRTFCVNYEANTSTDPPLKKAKQKLKNYKLKHSRLLTCYSALLYLLVVFDQAKTVLESDAPAMIRLTPTQRLEWLLLQPDIAHAHEKVHQFLNQYEAFLEVASQDEERLIADFQDKDRAERLMQQAYSFGEVIFEVLDLLGKRNRLHRLLLG